MQMRITLRPRRGGCRDVQVRAPSGATVADVADLLYRAGGVAAGPSEPAGATAHPGALTAHTDLWIGTRALASQDLLARVGLRCGYVLGVGAPAPRESGPQAAVRLHVVSGPDAGRVESIGRGRLCIGRDPACHVRLNDPDVSRQHAELTVTPSGISVRDLDSSNGTSILSPRAGPTSVDGVGRELPLDSYLALGETILCVAGVRTPTAATTESEDGQLLVNRPPRLDVAGPQRLQLPPEPPPDRRIAMPWIAAVVPALGGAGLAWFLHSPQFLAFALMSPLMLLLITFSDRMSGSRFRRRARATRQRQRIASSEAAGAIADAEAAFRRRAHPDPATLLVTATTPDARLWERRRPDSDFLEVRLGLGDAPARTVIRVGAETIEPRALPGVPAVVSMRDGPLGICGPRPLALPLARWVISQLAVLHSPADLRLAALLGGGVEEDWQWLRWLPHARAPTGELRVARSPQDRRRLVGELCALVDAATSPGRRDERRPWTVVLVDRCSATTEISALIDLDAAPGAGVTFAFLDAEARRLPAGCMTIAQLSGETGSRVRIRSRAERGREPAPTGSAVSPTPFGSMPSTPTGGASGAARLDDPVADRVSAQWCDRVARALAPLVDPAPDQANELPVSVRAWDLFALPDLAPNTIRARWERALGRAATPVGMGVDGPVEIDLGRDGPHALIAGTTGAGKSELLQTLVAGLALHSPPAELQFVLIDYKGGAAFGECARLPHTVGLVTDLDGHLTERALRSLDAELRRRETLFAGAGVGDLTAYRRGGRHVTEPLGRLVLVIDEFASLAEELPDFVTGLVAIAQRGRSLGVHLILATQRPGGVVSPEIRANTALRIALRVTDQNESSDVIGSELAANIDKNLPGRAVVRAAQSLVSMQVGRISTPAPDVGSAVEVIPLNRWGEPLAVPEPRSGSRPTDLEVIVSALGDAWADNPDRPRRPWLDPLPSWLDLAAIPTQATEDGGPFLGRKAADATVVLGLVDRPSEQSQVPFALDLRDPSTMVFAGGPRSGRTSVLRTTAVSAAHHLRVDDLHIYAIDCSGAGLRPLNDLPHCGAVVGRDAPASIAALIQRLSGELDRRRQLVAGTADPDGTQPAPALLLLLDGWEGFLSAVEDFDAGRTVDTLLHLLRDGAAAGLTVMITGDRATLAARLSSTVQRRFVLRLSDPGDYAVAGLSRKQIPAAMPAGRAVDTADGSEIQVGVLARDPAPAAQQEAVRRLITDAAERERREPSRRLPFSIRALPARVHLDELVGQCAPGRVVLGLGGESGEHLSIRVGAGLCGGTDVRFLVAGPVRSGRSTFLRTVLTQLVRAGHAVVAAGGVRSPLIAAARDQVVAVLDPQAAPGEAHQELEGLLAEGRPVTILIDDTELFTDTAADDRLARLIHRSPPGLDVFAAGRVEDLALAFRGVAAEIKRSRTGVLLQPGPGDGDLFGLRLPYHRSVTPPGRGLLIAPGLVTDPDDAGPLPLQVALP